MINITSKLKMNIGSLSSAPLPFEDAAMLFRYAENFAKGYGIVWNKGENPGTSDGATDLGFIFLLAPLIKMGLRGYQSALVLNVFSLFGLNLIIHRVYTKHLKSFKFPFIFIIFVLALFVWSPIIGGFSSSIFSFNQIDP